ncbi:MAG: HAMP domain-containing histidine kinase [Bacteroidota bacterium]|nr:HAMP domain-containing histidine kinase [Bacteroidota bacterium]
MHKNTNPSIENLDKITVDHAGNAVIKEKDEEIARLREELSGVYLYLNEFVYAAAHAMKSPVANLNLVTILLEKTNDVEEYKSYLQTIKNSIKKLDQTIHGLVQGFKVKTWDSCPELLSLDNIVEDLLLKNQGKLNCLPTKIRCNFEACPDIFYNKNILFEILNILTQNSFNYKSDSRDLEVSISSERFGDTVLLQVKDNGIGIDLDRHGKDLYQPFKKFSPSSQGNGMGLYLVKILLEKNKGCIEIESKLNFGTTVKFYLKEQQKIVK